MAFIRLFLSRNLLILVDIMILMFCLLFLGAKLKNGILWWLWTTSNLASSSRNSWARKGSSLNKSNKTIPDLKNVMFTIPSWLREKLLDHQTVIKDLSVFRNFFRWNFFRHYYWLFLFLIAQENFSYRHLVRKLYLIRIEYL